MNESFRPLALTITIWKKARADITIEKKKKKIRCRENLKYFQS